MGKKLGTKQLERLWAALERAADLAEQHGTPATAELGGTPVTGAGNEPTGGPDRGCKDTPR